MPALQAIYVPDPAQHQQGQPQTFSPVWQGEPPEPPEGADLTDLDLDGLPAWYEIWLGTEPGDPDTDNDGATDLEELQTMGTDPRLWDSNGNEVDDLQEWLLRHADADSDGLSDWDETYVHGTNQALFDTDGDGLGDGYELATDRENPPESKAASNPLAENTDGDSFPDAVDADCYFPSDWWPTLSIQPLPATGLPVGRHGQPYSFTFSLQQRSAAALWGPYVWEDGSLPSGLALVPAEDGLSCQLTGTVEDWPGYSGTHWVRVTDAYGNTDQLHFEFQVDDSGTPPPVPEIYAHADSLPPVAAGEFFSVQFSTTLHPPMSWWLSGMVPPGLYLDPMGTLSGTVEGGAQAGLYTFEVHASVEGVPISREFTIQVEEGQSGQFTIQAPEQPLPPATLDSPYLAQFLTNRPSQQVQWSLSGEVPAGLWINADGQLFGTPSALPPNGVAQFTVHAWTQAESTELTVWLQVQEPTAPTLSIHTEALPLPDVSPGSTLQVAFSTAPVAATDWQLSGDLPPGLSFAQGVLSGTVDAAATPGWYAFTLTATSPVMDGGSLSLEIQVLPAEVDDPSRDDDGDGLTAGLEQELSSETGIWLSDHNPASQGYHDWLLYYFVRLAPQDTDRDGDGLGDQLEQVFFQTDPDAAATAPGHTPDVVRLWLAYFQFFWDTSTDTDGDGLPDSLEGLLGLNPSAVDTDDDGLSDTEEAHLGGWFAFGTDPTLADTDLDGLPDGYEVSISTDPRRVDSDGDHLTDAEEAHGIFGSFNPLLYDTDDDGTPDFAEADLTDSDSGGIPDRLELFWGMDPQDARDEAYDVDSNGVSNRDSYLNGWDIYAQWVPQFDDDNDGMTNVYEAARGLNPADPTDGADDPDGDYLTNAEESRAHTSPFQAMTPGFENTFISEQDAYGNPLSTRQAQSDYEAATGHSLRPPLPGRPALTRDNGPDPARQHDDDWDGDGVRNLDELYPASGLPTDPRVFDVEEVPLSIA
ncbi:MAG: putative Ig domain-containing protein, partial [Prosthecobacter sp.]|nr:putative Ig domain-containing protein [Prosthecobacter sp.]